MIYKSNSKKITFEANILTKTYHLGNTNNFLFLKKNSLNNLQIVKIYIKLYSSEIINEIKEDKNVKSSMESKLKYSSNDWLVFDSTVANIEHPH